MDSNLPIYEDNYVSIGARRQVDFSRPPVGWRPDVTPAGGRMGPFARHLRVPAPAGGPLTVQGEVPAGFSGPPSDWWGGRNPALSRALGGCPPLEEDRQPGFCLSRAVLNEIR